jgi:hypothetical protein
VCQDVDQPDFGATGFMMITKISSFRTIIVKEIELDRESFEKPARSF